MRTFYSIVPITRRKTIAFDPKDPAWRNKLWVRLKTTEGAKLFIIWPRVRKLSAILLFISWHALRVKSDINTIINLSTALKWGLLIQWFARYTGQGLRERLWRLFGFWCIVGVVNPWSG